MASAKSPAAQAAQAGVEYDDILKKLSSRVGTILEPNGRELALLAEGRADELSEDDVLHLARVYFTAGLALHSFAGELPRTIGRRSAQGVVAGAKAFADVLTGSRLLVHVAAALRMATRGLCAAARAAAAAGGRSAPKIRWHRLGQHALEAFNGFVDVSEAFDKIARPARLALTPAWAQALDGGILEAFAAVLDLDPSLDWSTATAALAEFIEDCQGRAARDPQRLERKPEPLAGCVLMYLYWMASGSGHDRDGVPPWSAAFFSRLKSSGVLQSMCRHALAAAALEPDWQRKTKEQQQQQQQDGSSSNSRSRSGSTTWKYHPFAAAQLADAPFRILSNLIMSFRWCQMRKDGRANAAPSFRALTAALLADRAVLDLLLVVTDSLHALYPQQQQQQQPALPPDCAALPPLPPYLHPQYEVILDSLTPVEAAAELAPASGPPSAELGRQRGNAAFKAQDYEYAASYYSRALEFKPGDATISANRAAAYLKLGLWREAEADCDAVLSAEAGHVKALLRRMTARAELGNVDGACADAKAALEVEPGSAEASTMLQDVNSGTWRRRALFDLSGHRKLVGLLAYDLFVVLDALMGRDKWAELSSNGSNNNGSGGGSSSSGGSSKAEQTLRTELASGRHLVRLMALTPHVLHSNMPCACCNTSCHLHLHTLSRPKELAEPHMSGAAAAAASSSPPSAVGAWQAARLWVRASCSYALRQVYVAHYVDAAAAGGEALRRLLKRADETGADAGLRAFADDSCLWRSPLPGLKAPDGTDIPLPVPAGMPFYDKHGVGFSSLLRTQLQYRAHQLVRPEEASRLPVLTASQLVADSGPLHVLCTQLRQGLCGKLLCGVLDTDAPLLLRIIEATLRLGCDSGGGSGGRGGADAEGGNSGGGMKAPERLRTPMACLMAAKLLYQMVIVTTIPAAWMQRVDSGGPAARGALRGLMRTIAKVAQRLTHAPALDANGSELLDYLRRTCAALPGPALASAVTQKLPFGMVVEAVEDLMVMSGFGCSRDGLTRVGCWCQQQMWAQLGMRGLLRPGASSDNDVPAELHNSRNPIEAAATRFVVCFYGSWGEMEAAVVNALDAVIVTASAEAAGVKEDEALRAVADQQPTASGQSGPRSSKIKDPLQAVDMPPHLFAFKPFGCWCPSCTNLSGASEALLKLKKCGRCGEAAYCSADCQKADWARHKPYCRAETCANETATATVQLHADH